MRRLTKDSPGIEIELLCEREDIEIEGNAMASGDDAVDEEQNAWVRAQLASGNEWAWCCARVRVTYSVAIPGKAFPARVEGNAYLGACSYLSEEDFRKDAYADMEIEAFDDLNERLRALCPC